MFSSSGAFPLLYPPEEFLEKSSTWKHTLRSSIPLKTPTKSKLFWSNWAHFIQHSVASEDTADVWKACVTNWQSLCTSSVVNNEVLIPATYALVALAREIKNHHGDNTATVMREGVKVFDSVAKCLDSTIEEKKACGMALAQVMADLHTVPSSKDDNSSSGERTKLEFSSSSPVFREIIDFYENGCTTTLSSLSRSIKKLKLNQQRKVEVLDSDDEMEDEESEQDGKTTNLPSSVDYVYSGESTTEDFLAFDEQEEEFPIDERIQNLRSRNVKLPAYFSEIVEVLLEGAGQTVKNDNEVEALKHIAVMRIPVLLSVGVRIDANMAKTLTRQVSVIFMV
jgi:hypothetical protein